MKKLTPIVILVLILALLVTPLIALASDISAARYYGTIIVSNNSTATTNVAVNCSISTQGLIDGNYSNSSANNCVIRSSAGADLPFMPSANASYPWAIWVPSIGNLSHLSDILYTANSTGGEIRYFPGDAGMATADNQPMELAANFTIEQRGFWDTTDSVNKTAVLKPHIYRTFISGTENITTAFGTFLDYFNIDDWVDVGTKIGVNTATSRFEFESERSAVDTRSSYDLGTALGNTWNLDFTCNVTDPRGTAANTASFYFGIADTQENYSGAGGDWLLIQLYDANNDAVSFDTRVLRLDGGVQGASAFITGLSANTTYYFSLERVDATNASLSVFTDEDRTVHFVGSPKTLVIPATVTALQYVQGSNFDDGAGAAREVIGWLDDIELDAVRVTATGVSSGEYTVKTERAPLVWATGNTTSFAGGATSEIDCGVSYNASAKLWTSLWFKLDNDSAGTQYLITKRVDGTHLLRLSLVNDALKFTLRDGPTMFDITHVEAGNFQGGQWYYVLASISSVNGVRLRVNNQVAVTDADVTAAPNGGDFEIGNENNSVSGFKGVIANVIVGIDDLTTTEEAELYYGTAPGDETDFWYIDEGSGTNIISYGSAPNNGTAGAGTTWGTGSRPSKFAIFIDGTTADSQARTLASVPDNSANWIFLQNNVMPYMEYQFFTVNSTQVQYIDWEYDDTTFSDNSSYNNDATPSFRTTSSDIDVTAVLSSFLPIAEAQAPAFVLTEAPDFIDAGALTGNVTAPFTVVPPAGTFPLAGVVVAIANATATPPQLPLLLIAAFIIIACSLTVSATLRKYGSGSLIAKVVAITAAMGIFIAIGNFGIDFWMLFVFLVIAIAFSMASKQVGWQ